jgi:FKBP-type peptidyl-prolyl cis-trans isomerase FklB
MNAPTSLPTNVRCRRGNLANRLVSILAAAGAAVALGLPSLVQAQASAVRAPSPGLTYTSVREGTGASPTAADAVRVHYRGTLMDGTEFDSSYKRGQPATFPVNRVIKGWTEALQLMPEGSKWQIFVPAELAYGDSGAGPQIGPGATLIFEIELISIQKKEAAK